MTAYTLSLSFVGFMAFAALVAKVDAVAEARDEKRHAQERDR